MKASLLSLYQEDARAPRFPLAAPATGVADWVSTLKDYLDSVAMRFGSGPGLSPVERNVASGCLNLAVEALQAGALASLALQPTASPAEPVVRDDRRVIVFAVVLACMGVLNLWLLSAPGIVTTIILAALFAYLYWADLTAALGSLTRRRRNRSAVWRPGPSAAPEADCRRPAEAILRRTDAIVRLSAPKPPPPPPVGLKDTTLQFFQDLLEAKLTGDQDYAFRKATREAERVLASEGIGIETDAEGKPVLFRIDTIADPDRDGQYLTIRPALVQGARCLMPGYAHRFAASS